MTAVASRNIRFVGHSDQDGRSDGVQVMVHRGYAYVGHGFSNGITVLDVRDPKHPRVVEFIACPPNTRAIHLQAHSYPSVKSILARGLDRQNVIESAPLAPPVEHPNIRGAAYYAGSLFEEVAE